MKRIFRKENCAFYAIAITAITAAAAAFIIRIIIEWMVWWQNISGYIIKWVLYSTVILYVFYFE